MSKLSIDQKSIVDYFSAKDADFLIPDYQRPYAWNIEECQTLWDDILSFSFPEGNPDNFPTNEEYFLGPIVTFKNENGLKEIIDGQQRLTTLMLLLRAFYARMEHQIDNNSIKTKELIGKSIWKTDEFGNPNMNSIKLISDVTSDENNNELLAILKDGKVKEDQKSLYAQNYRFFEKQINDFISMYQDYFSYLPIRLLNNCILLPIEADSQDSALRIFSTLNDRGKPLADSDIFKAQLYKFYSGLGKKDEFIEKWKNLEEKCSDIFLKDSKMTPMDDLFTRYMYYERAKQGVKGTTTEAVRKFYEKNDYKLLKSEETFENLLDLAKFWENVYSKDPEIFNDQIRKDLFILENAPNSMWTYLLSVYYLTKRDEEGKLDEEEFHKFLAKTIGFIWAFGLQRPGISYLRAPIFAELSNLVQGKEVTFEKFLFDPKEIDNIIENFQFTNQKQITKSMLAWWLFQNEEQNLLPLGTPLQVEHIYPVNRDKNENRLINKKNLEAIGNKSYLERDINIRASDYRFKDKKEYYLGKRGRKKRETQIEELKKIAKEKDDFLEADIAARTAQIKSAFIDYLNRNNLIKRDV